MVLHFNVTKDKRKAMVQAIEKEMCSFFGEQCREHGLTHSYRDTYYVKDYFMMDVKLRGNTISYALPYRRKKNGEPVSVRGKRLGERFTVSGITEYLVQKEKKRIEYQRI